MPIAAGFYPGLSGLGLTGYHLRFHRRKSFQPKIYIGMVRSVAPENY